MDKNRLWQEAAAVEAEKMGGHALAQLLKNLSESQQEILLRIGNIEACNARNGERLDQITRGFPAGDLEGHRRYHETVIEARELRNKLVRAALEQMARVGGVAALGWLLYAIWTAAKWEIKK